jgi:predicted Rossmann fold nucleotide-binding protein DprA/Smf involved in DNA uptake
VRTLSGSERHAWVRLARTENVGPVTFASLIARFGGAAAALAELPRMAVRGGGKNFVLPPEDGVAREIADLAKLGGRLIASCEPDFPQGLAALDPPPPLIALLGHAPLFEARNGGHRGRAQRFRAGAQILFHPGAGTGCRWIGDCFRYGSRNRRCGA